jgi:DNA invertase Pin-like site-specific DNA recombinase
MAEPPRKLRCAIYTRKSTEDGLEQEFNSLDAQYEACRAYILSQRHEGWSLVSERYDDGGFSGGTLERPALKNLLEHVASRKVDIIVIYKVDRLTRSLADFAKIVEVLDGAGASFVSITQSFNTTTSMGRLTLNMLLSFAQFEREVTSERIRDKIAASKRKGLWMGGPVPLGYEVRERKLVVNEAEAETVRHIMRRYCELNSVRELVSELRHAGVVTKVQKRVSGSHKGGIPFARGALYHLLKNRIYLGEVVHKGTAYPGEHPPIVAIELWDRVQTVLAERAASAGSRTCAKRRSLLAGLLYDDLGRPMVPSHTTKGTRSYRYYVTRADLVGHDPAWRTSAHDIEGIVRSCIAELLRDRRKIEGLIAAVTADLGEVHKALERAAQFSSIAATDYGSECVAQLRQLIVRVMFQRDAVSIEIDRTKLLLALCCAPLTTPGTSPLITLTCAASRVRRGHSLKLMVPASTHAIEPAHPKDARLIRTLADAYAARRLIEAKPHTPLSKIALEQKCCRTRLARLVAVSCLAPDIIAGILEGGQPRILSRRSLLSLSIPLEWNQQRATFGIQSRDCGSA